MVIFIYITSAKQKACLPQVFAWEECRSLDLASDCTYQTHSVALGSSVCQEVVASYLGLLAFFDLSACSNNIQVHNCTLDRDYAVGWSKNTVQSFASSNALHLECSMYAYYFFVFMFMLIFPKVGAYIICYLVYLDLPGVSLQLCLHAFLQLGEKW